MIPSSAESAQNSLFSDENHIFSTSGFVLRGMCVILNNVYEQTGRGSVWLERCVRDAEAGGSNPLAPTNIPKKSHGSFPMGFFLYVNNKLRQNYGKKTSSNIIYYYCSFSFFEKDFSMRISVARSAFTNAEPPEPFASFAINVLFQHGILNGIIGSAARHFLCNLCDLWFLTYCIFVIFMTFVVPQ